MSQDHEDLSRLLSGELDDHQASTLRARIASEPALASSWTRLRSLGPALLSLPDEAPPAALDARVLGRPEARRAVRWPLWVPVFALAAVVLFWVGLRRGSDQITLVRGEQVLEGHLSVLAGDVPVRVDGKARVTVEPDRGVVRATGREGEMKTVLGAGAGALGGALVTVAVLQGRATMSLPEGDVVVQAGDTRQIDRRSPSKAQGVPIGPTSTDVGALHAEIAALRAQLDEATLLGAVAKGQLIAEQGTPVPWPADVAPEYQPAAFEAAIKAQLEKFPGAELAEIDCSEFPCVATLRMTDLADGWEDRLRGLPEGLKGTYPDGGVWMGIRGFETDHGEGAAVGLSMLPKDVGEDA